MGNYEQFDQLMLADNGGLTIEQQQFKDLHERICYNAKKSAEHWVEMASGIREMRDSKRYKVAGFDDFADYTVNALRIKERQAYNYISVIEKLPEAFIRAHATIGVTKLALLTSVSEEERKEILETIDIDAPTTTAADINAAVKAAIEERDKAQQQLEFVLGEKAELEKENANYQTEYSDLVKEQNGIRAEKKRLEEENKDLLEKLNKAKAKIAKPDVVFQADPEQEKKLEQAQAEKASMEKEMEALRKCLEQAETANPGPAKVEIKGDAIVVFKVKFEMYQDLLEEMNTLIGEMDDASAKKCKAAVHAVFDDCGI